MNKQIKIYNEETTDTKAKNEYKNRGHNKQE